MHQAVDPYYLPLAQLNGCRFGWLQLSSLELLQLIKITGWGSFAWVINADGVCWSFFCEKGLGP